jgi:hypothetical protein
MALASLIFSILALLVATASAWFTRRQAVIDAERRRDERTPVFSGEIEAVHAGDTPSWYRLKLRLDSREALLGLSVAIVDSDGVRFAPSQEGVGSPSPSATAKRESLQPAESAVWQVLLDEQRAGHLQLRIDCRDQSGLKWTVPHRMPVPPPPPRFF